MGLNDTPSGERIHIGFFGRRNAGKSSLVNAVTGQNLAIVSEVKGTTTDPVYKSMELLPLGPVVIIDTPGIDDEGEIGEMRVKKAYQVLRKTDIAVLVCEASCSFSCAEQELINAIKEREIPFVIVQNKCDLLKESDFQSSNDNFPVSAKTAFNVDLLKEKIASLAVNKEPKKRLAGDLINADDIALLVIPIDGSAPKGRLILPQQQVIRDVLDSEGIIIAAKENALKETLASLAKKPALVITDSQVFEEVSAIVPKEIPLTSFSILFARYKGILEISVKSAKILDELNDGDKILICEGCTHHRQCEDIGTVKIPRMIKSRHNKEIEFDFRSAGDFPDELSPYKLIIHCGACMLNDREMRYRRDSAKRQNIPFTNYGITIAYLKGILLRSIEIFGNLPEIYASPTGSLLP